MQSKTNVMQLTLFVFFNYFTDGILAPQGKWQIPSIPKGEQVRGVDRASLPPGPWRAKASSLQRCISSIYPGLYEFAVLYFLLVLC